MGVVVCMRTLCPTATTTTTTPSATESEMSEQLDCCKKFNMSYHTNFLLIWCSDIGRLFFIFEGNDHFPLFQVARVTCAARFDIEPVGHCPHCPLPLPHPMQSAQSSTLEKCYNATQCPNIRGVVQYSGLGCPAQYGTFPDIIMPAGQ